MDIINLMSIISVDASTNMYLTMNALVTLDQLVVSVHLNGSRGRNRATSPGQLAATDDRSAVLAWLARYADSPATLASYRKEAERLMLWCGLQHGVALSDLTHEDLLVYQRFLADPQPAERWVMKMGQKPGRNSSLWRPFAGPLGASSQRQALSILNAMLSWLVEAGYLAGNPLALNRRKRRQQAPRVSRFLPMEHWEVVKSTIEAMPVTNERDRRHASRCRWLFSLLYIGGLRVSEICETTMGGFFSRRGTDGREQGPEFEAAAAHIEQASTHWMRHTAGSHLSEKADLKVVRDNLGHANISTTSIYLHSEDDARHDATTAAHRVGWHAP